MRCPNCSNELSLDEAFCGQCGTPVILSAKPTRILNASSNHQVPLANGYDSQTQAVYPDPQQQHSFYHDATEAFSALPPNQSQNFHTMYPQQSYANAPMMGSSSGASQYTPQIQPFQSRNYSGTMYPPTSMQTGQGYGITPGFTPPPKKRSNLALIIISICIIMATIAIVAFGAAYLFRNKPSAKSQSSHQHAAATSIPTPTSVPDPSPTPVPSPSASPSPTLTPTATPDAGFSFCDATCISNGYSVEYPSAWLPRPTADSTGIQFTNSSQADEFAAFKTPGTTVMNAGQLVSTDLNNFSSQQGYIAPTPTPASNATIGGENWSYQIAYYQLNNQAARIEVFATIHLGKAYIIELQAINAQFDVVNTQYFERMLVRFQFQ